MDDDDDMDDPDTSCVANSNNSVNQVKGSSEFEVMKGELLFKYDSIFKEGLGRCNCNCTSNSVNQIGELEDMKEELLSKHDSVFKEDLGPLDSMKGVVRVELQDNDVKPLHFTTPAQIPAHLHRAADRELARCLAAGTLEECQHYTPWVSRGLFVTKPQKPGQPLKARLVSDFRMVNKNLGGQIGLWKVVVVF